MAELEKTHKDAEDPKKKARWQGNVAKQTDANAAYNKACKELDDSINLLEERLKATCDLLCFKFSREVEAQFYTEINQLFQKIEDVGTKMRDVALQVAQGSFSHLANSGSNTQMDLNIDF
jgi:hypothetical protein